MTVHIFFARDTFALLPVEKTIAHVVHKSKELLVAAFDRDKFHELDLVGKDASDVIKDMTIKIK